MKIEALVTFQHNYSGVWGRERIPPNTVRVEACGDHAFNHKKTNMFQPKYALEPPSQGCIHVTLASLANRFGCI